MAITTQGWLKLLWLGVGGLVVLAVVNWRGVVLILALVLSGFAYQPPLVKNLEETGKPAFTARLNRTFPAGTPEAILISKLRKQRFTVDPKARAAKFDGEWLPCNYLYDVRWSVDPGGRIAKVEGEEIQGPCL
jgi:hypothetical protein